MSVEGSIRYGRKEVKEKEEVVDEDFKDVKKANKKNPVLKVISILLWVLILAWLVVVIFDFYKVSQEEDPVFCISKETITYDDGTVDLCTGLGYKKFIIIIVLVLVDMNLDHSGLRTYRTVR